MKYEYSAGIIVFRKDDGIKYLLLHYDKDYWGFAKGNVEKGESEEGAAHREVKEEAGITDLKLVKGFKEKEHYFYKKEGQLISKDVVYFLGETNTEKVTVSFEHKGHSWLAFEDALARLKFKNSKELLTKVHRFLQQSM
jgi:8-oxo-dGTP pyrophosphatase MutT (NUDIX family)